MRFYTHVSASIEKTKISQLNPILENPYEAQSEQD